MALFGGATDEKKGGKTPFDKAGKAAAASSSPPQLYPWFRRKPGRVYNVISSEAPVSEVRGVVGNWMKGASP